mmetsp:Transcript_124903/g.233542  ORF Transcript_124903/g.233542 Transcript_124903/m.233542 type:complete len:84 (-) Transcript_124903:737-988(-)
MPPAKTADWSAKGTCSEITAFQESSTTNGQYRQRIDRNKAAKVTRHSWLRPSNRAAKPSLLRNSIMNARGTDDSSETPAKKGA